jgi:hypothetical protein
VHAGGLWRLALRCSHRYGIHSGLFWAHQWFVSCAVSRRWSCVLVGAKPLRPARFGHAGRRCGPQAGVCGARHGPARFDLTVTDHGAARVPHCVRGLWRLVHPCPDRYGPLSVTDSMSSSHVSVQTRARY